MGRWSNVPRENRVCTFCNLNAVGDEFHYLFVCTDAAISNARNKYLPDKYTIRPNIHKFQELFQSSNVNLLRKVSNFIGFIKERVCPPG